MSARGLAAAAAWLLAGCAGTSSQVAAPAALPPGAEARSLFGEPLVPAPPSPEARRAMESQLADARRAYARTPNDADSLIWLGRRTAYLGRFNEAIRIFSEGIAKHPDDARMYRHRGHRYITVRRLDDAIADFQRAAALIEGRPDEVEPDGQPNARNIPTSTLQSNIWYHLGLAHYLKGDFDAARRAYEKCMEVSKNPDNLVATSHWLYMTLRRQGRETDAAALLAPIHPGLEIIENGSYMRLLLMYKGQLSPDSVLAERRGDDAALDDATLGYGVGNWYLYNGRRADAERVFRRVLAGPQWGAFGYVAAEADMVRLGGRSRD